MCYVVLLSTTSSVDLGADSSELVKFERELPQGAAIDRLLYPHRWYVGSKSGCSCTFRHLLSTELGFGAPEEWYPEEPDEIAATLELVRVVRRLVEEGERVDCVDAWEHADPSLVSAASRTVDLARISDEEFRFFENHHFVFVGARTDENGREWIAED